MNEFELEDKSMPLTEPLALIQCIQQGYEELTQEVIDKLLYRLYAQYQIVPEYLFLSENGAQVLARSIHLYFSVDQYINKVTGKPLHVVVLPTLPDNTLLVGSLQLLHVQKMMPDGSIILVR